jgi:hypothetical protein
MCKGLDIGTGNIVASSIGEDEKSFEYRVFRNLFVLVDKSPFVRSMLNKISATYVEFDNQIYALGQQALELANVFNSEPKRPMSQGVLNPAELKALPVIQAIVGEVLGLPGKRNQRVVYSIPGDPVDQKFNVVYHSNVFNKMLLDRGYLPVPLNEGLAVIYSELLEDNLSGFGVSFGAGMCNVCCAQLSVPAFSFSVARSGDYIDENVGRSLGISNVKAMFAKEGLVDLRRPTNSTEEAIVYYYKHLLEYVSKHMKEALLKLPRLPEFQKPPKVAVAGGTALPAGFIELFEEALKAQNFPIKLGNVVKAEDPLKAIAKGCLFAALGQDS